MIWIVIIDETGMIGTRAVAVIQLSADIPAVISPTTDIKSANIMIMRDGMIGIMVTLMMDMMDMMETMDEDTMDEAGMEGIIIGDKDPERLNRSTTCNVALPSSCLVLMTQHNELLLSDKWLPLKLSVALLRLGVGGEHGV